MAVPLVLIVEDDPAIRELVGFHLGRAGMEVVAASGAAEARAACVQRWPDVVVLDLMLPDGSGWDLCRELGERAGPGQVRPAVLMLTALGSEADRVAGLELGADDYVAKPFSPRELVARVKAVLRRTENAGGSQVLFHPELVIDYRANRVEVSGREVSLAPKEFELLWFLASRPRQVFTRDELLERVWDYSYTGDGRTVDTHIRRLREKLKTDSGRSYLKTVWGKGYKFEVSG